VSAMATASIIFACVFGGALFGVFLRRALPKDLLGADSMDVVKLGMGLLATMSAVVLGLLIASAKTSFDTQKRGYEQMSADLVLLDSMLARYGAEAQEARDLLRHTAVVLLERLRPQDPARSYAPTAASTSAGNRPVYDRMQELPHKIQELPPQNDAQRWLQSQALQISADLARTRWLLVEEGEGSSIPIAFLVVLVFWLAVLFASFGLFGPPNATVITTLLVSALSISGALFLILELDQPFGGLIRISSRPLHDALAHLGQ
jgi:hypothetical protein